MAAVVAVEVSLDSPALARMICYSSSHRASGHVCIPSYQSKQVWEMQKAGSWNQTPAMGILGQCLDEEAPSCYVYIHTPLTHPRACMDRVVIQISLSISVLLVRPAHVITSGMPMWEEKG